MTNEFVALDHLLAVESILKDAGITTYLVEATSPVSYPFVVVWAPASAPHSESLCGQRNVVQTSIRTTITANTVRNCLVLHRKVRSLLDNASPRVEGRFIEPLKVSYETWCQTDKDVTIMETNRHPAFIVIDWELTSVPR